MDGRTKERGEEKMISYARLTCVAILMIMFLSGCTTLSAKAKTIHDADPQMVQGCQFLGDVQGSSEWGGPSSIAKENARNEALEKAASLNATHIYWIQFTIPPNPSYYGRAYKCP